MQAASASGAAVCKECQARAQAQSAGSSSEEGVREGAHVDEARAGRVGEDIGGDIGGDVGAQTSATSRSGGRAGEDEEEEIQM
jgi:hypothetical protein